MSRNNQDERKAGDKGGKYHHGDLRRALVEAAVQLVREEGPAGITLREAARRAGVTHAAPYRHFADKQALLAAVAEEGFLALRDFVEQAIVDRGDVGALEAAGLAYVSFARDNPSQFRVMFGDQLRDKSSYPELMRVDQAVFDLITGVIEKAQRRGDVASGEPAGLALVAWSMVHGVASLAVDGQMDRVGLQGDQVDALVGRVVATIHAGIQRRTT